ncbi:hypothetical protein [Pseudogracilibacillus sp. SO30301A]|uniref:hypothetical protein n=1 Tax=Pseudogracilibacillus sp. SO30301A TaxID=3098291 RepID=UPI00300E0CB6
MFISLLILQIVTLIYHQVTTRVDLYPFNAVRFYSEKERQIETTVNGVVMGIPIIFTLTQNPILISIGGCIWILIITGAILNWWLPYVTGQEFYKMSKEETWVETYERIFAKTIIILPYLKNNPRPNLEHMILHSLIFCSMTFSWVYIFLA